MHTQIYHIRSECCIFAYANTCNLSLSFSLSLSLSLSHSNHPPPPPPPPCPLLLHHHLTTPLPSCILPAQRSLA